MSVTSKAPNPEKGKRYLASLDQALCDGRWSEVPELARKTDKHAPERSCFTLVARTEAQIASASHRPTSASSTGTASLHSLGEAIPRLQQAFTGPKTTPDEAYCASACIAEIHWLQSDATAALKALPRDVQSSSTSGGRSTPLGWLEVCEAKAAYIRAAALETTGHAEEAQSVYQAAAVQAPGTRTQELRRWTERLIARGCMYSYRAASQPTLAALNESLISFRSWASFWQRAPTPVTGSGVTPSRVDIPRRGVWKAYYDLLSTILRHGTVYNTATSSGQALLLASRNGMTDERLTEARKRQRAELRQVEVAYESQLLSHTQFPKASESNTEVESWVEEAMSNWKLLCGADWSDEELGERGKVALGRGMLDILYRAATKTFHSTAILRQLFTVHAALGEYDLAMHAFNSYVEIIGKAKARAEKAAEHEPGFDDDDTAVLTAVEAVRVLCKYGDREQAEKALEVGTQIQKWLGEQAPQVANDIEASDDTRPAGIEPPRRSTVTELQPYTIAAAYKAIGISKAEWSRTTYDSDARLSLQTQAIEALKQALSRNSSDLETIFALGQLLADAHDVSSAVTLLKGALAASRASIEEDGDYSKQRQLIPLWHLFSLCLTATDEYDGAIKMCDAAFEQFGEPQNLYGQSLASVESATRPRAQRGVVDQMDDFEKEALLQLKMSQLTLLELTEGPEQTVDSSNELLQLYARLFGSIEDLKVPAKRPATAATMVPPPSKAGGGTLRSIAGSIRPRSNRNSAEKEGQRVVSGSTANLANTSTARSPASNGHTTGAPIAITVTNEDGEAAGKEKSGHHHHDHHLHLPFKVRGHNGDFSKAGSLRSKKSTEALNEKHGASHGDPPAVPPKDFDATGHAQTNTNTSGPQQPMKEVPHSRSPADWPEPIGHDQNPPEQDVRLPAPPPTSHGSTPLPHANLLQERQHKTGVLVNVWLFVAGLYVRAGFYDDAAGAVEESVRLVEAFEAEKEAQQANALALYQKGWGGGKSVDELWGDVLAAKGDLASARELPFEAMEYYEHALSYFPDHADGIIGISNLLMDIYEQKMPAEPPQPPLYQPTSSSNSLLPNSTAQHNTPTTQPSATAGSHLASPGRSAPPPRNSSSKRDPSPAELNRLAARDRAYMLLSSLTKLGTGWDLPEAWLVLARAYELSGQLGKAKEALWWVVELEEGRGIRGFEGVLGGGGYVL
ncbi:hypothetical protein LTR86_002933 [Recurvomyces mirabilis]|nr:hypothetical protein LTR86_002933 [Recurvomyces mirabilis]